MQSSSHKWVFGKTYEKEKKVWETNREGSVYVFVCGGLRLLRKKTVLHVPQKHPSTAPNHLVKQQYILSLYPTPSAERQNGEREDSCFRQTTLVFFKQNKGKNSEGYPIGS